MLIKKIGILYHPMVEATCTKTRELDQFLSSHGISTWTCSAWDIAKAVTMLDSTDLILTSGGDGTILRAAQVALERQIPITGINMGNLGFLTEFKANEALDKLPDLLAGQGWMDERTMLEARIEMPESPTVPPAVFHALNDVVLARGAVAKLIQVNTSIDGQPLTNYRADGVILATATGSTGYSLAAGGPMIYPQSVDMLLVPIVSHLSWRTSLILPASSTVTLQLITVDPATVSIDGHTNIPVSSGTTITVKQSPQKTRFLRLYPKNNFVQVLEEKLRGRK